MENESGMSSSSSSSSSSSRKRKKCNSDEPRIPQRGLGVAALEWLRLRGQMGCNCYPPPRSLGIAALDQWVRLSGQMDCNCHPSSLTPYPNNSNQVDMGLQMPYSSSMQLASFPPSTPYAHHPSIPMGSTIIYGDSHPTSSTPPTPSGIVEKQLFAQAKQRKSHMSSSMGSSSQDSESSTVTRDIDLELRLSL